MTLGDLTTLVLRSFFSEIFKRCLAFYGRIDATAFTSISALYLTPPPPPSPYPLSNFQCWRFLSRWRCLSSESSLIWCRTPMIGSPVELKTATSNCLFTVVFSGARISWTDELTHLPPHNCSQLDRCIWLTSASIGAPRQLDNFRQTQHSLLLICISFPTNLMLFQLIT